MIEELYPVTWQCEYPQNLQFAEGVCKSTMPIFVKTKITAINNVINCLIFSFRPPPEYSQGNEAYPVSIDLKSYEFEQTCIVIFKQYKEKSKILYEKLIELGYLIDMDTEIAVAPATIQQKKHSFRRF